MAVVSLQWKELIIMTKRVLPRLAALGVLIAAFAVAADVNGKWKAEFTTPDGTQRVNTFTFKVDGGKLTGTVQGAQDDTPIQNGKVDGDEISFTAERPFGAFSYKGKVGAGEIKFNVEFNGQNFAMTAKRIPN
jgi:hypothetical protein